jgi:Kef-type K+ transport system membrane component KefB
LPRTKKKKPEESKKKSMRRANLFFIANIVLILFLGFLRITYNLDTGLIISTYLLITAVTLVCLWFKDRRAANEALSMLRVP